MRSRHLRLPQSRRKGTPEQSPSLEGAFTYANLRKLRFTVAHICTGIASRSATGINTTKGPVDIREGRWKLPLGGEKALGSSQTDLGRLCRALSPSERRPCPRPAPSTPGFDGLIVPRSVTSDAVFQGTLLGSDGRLGIRAAGAASAGTAPNDLPSVRARRGRCEPGKRSAWSLARLRSPAFGQRRRRIRRRQPPPVRLDGNIQNQPINNSLYYTIKGNALFEVKASTNSASVAALPGLADFKTLGATAKRQKAAVGRDECAQLRSEPPHPGWNGNCLQLRLKPEALCKGTLIQYEVTQVNILVSPFILSASTN